MSFISPAKDTDQDRFTNNYSVWCHDIKDADQVKKLAQSSFVVLESVTIQKKIQLFRDQPLLCFLVLLCTLPVLSGPALQIFLLGSPFPRYYVAF